MPLRDRLIIFTRYPEPGKTKTRLVPALGEAGAADLQRRMTERMLYRAKRAQAFHDFSIEVRYEGGDEIRMRRWLENRKPAAAGGVDFLLQEGRGLGERMARAFQAAFRYRDRRVVLVGADCPGVTARTLNDAFKALADHDVVLGPAEDGGYYLVGLKRPALFLFRGIEWGGDAVLADTVAKADKENGKVALLEHLRDIDRPEDIDLLEGGMARETVSVIIPALNEAERVADAVGSALRAGAREIIVADGGSGDETVRRAEESGARVIACEKGRGRQMNAGAAEADGDILLFLHADGLLPPDGADWARLILGRGALAGAFELKIDQPQSLSLRLIERVVQFRSRRLQWPYGDQALFLRAETFRRFGGFPDMPLMEDYEMVRRLRREGVIEIARAHVAVSARRWRRLGAWRTTLRNLHCRVAYRLGVSPKTIAGWYYGE